MVLPPWPSRRGRAVPVHRKRKAFGPTSRPAPLRSTKAATKVAGRRRRRASPSPPPPPLEEEPSSLPSGDEWGGFD